MIVLFYLIEKCNGVYLSCNAIILRGKVSYYGKFK